MAEVGDGEPLRLPPGLAEKIDRQMRDGVSCSCRYRLPVDDPGWLSVAAIHWRPGDPNTLAASIVEHVTGDTPMPLDLDGQKFMVVRVEEWPEGWDQDT